MGSFTCILTRMRGQRCEPISALQLRCSFLPRPVSIMFGRVNLVLAGLLLVRFDLDTYRAVTLSVRLSLTVCLD